MKMLLPLLIVSTLIGCSGTSTIARSSESTRTHAAAITSQAMGGGQTVKDLRTHAEGTEADLHAAKDSGDVGPRALPHVESALSHQTAILKYTVDLDKGLLSIQQEAAGIGSDQAKIVTALPQVQDVTPQWLQALKSAIWIVGPIALIILLWQTGLGSFIKQVVWSFGLFLPRATDISAKFDAETIETGAPTPTPREAVAARRAADPAYDIAYRKHQARIRANPTPPIPGEISDGN